MSKFFWLEKFVFFALIFTLPFQKRIFLFRSERFFEWSSGFLYVTDFLVLCLFILWIRAILTGIVPIKIPREALPLLVFLGLAFISLTQAELVDVGIYRFLKLAEFIFLFFYVASHVGHRMSHIKQVLWAFIASGMFQSILGILQFAKQSSLGLEIFHESTLRIGMEGVAEVSASGAEFIRAYGTFPSPNVLAGFLGICLLFAFYLFLKGGRGQYYFLPPAIFILSFALLLTFSRGVIIFFLFTSILFFVGMFFLKQFQQYKKSAVRLAILIIVSWVLVTAAAWPEASSRFLESSVNEPAIQERIFFNEIGIGTMRQNYAQALFGVGMGHFVHSFMESVPGLPAHLYQPVHNIFILIASEIGMLGFFAFILFIAVLLGRPIKMFWALLKHIQITHDHELFVYVLSLLCVACFMLLIGMYDHYFWTLQQGGLMFWVALGLLASATSMHNKA